MLSFNNPASAGAGLAADVAGSAASASSSSITTSNSKRHSSSTPAASQQSNRRHVRMQQERDRHEEEQQQQQQSPPAESYAGGGVVGVFVAAWMGLIGLLLRLLQPVMSLALLVLSPLTQASPARAKHKLQKLVRGGRWPAASAGSVSFTYCLHCMPATAMAVCSLSMHVRDCTAATPGTSPAFPG